MFLDLDDWEFAPRHFRFWERRDIMSRKWGLLSCPPAASRRFMTLTSNLIEPVVCIAWQIRASRNQAQTA